MKKLPVFNSTIFHLTMLICMAFFGFSVVSTTLFAADESKPSEKDIMEKEDSDKPKPFDKVVPDAVKIPGLINLYQKKKPKNWLV